MKFWNHQHLILLLPGRSTEVEGVILLHFIIPTLLLNFSIPPGETTLEHLDVANVLDITTILTLKVFHPAITGVHARKIWFILSDTTKSYRQALIHHHLVLLVLPSRAVYLPSEGLFLVPWVFIRFSLVSPESSPFDSLPTIPSLLPRGFFERKIEVRVLPSPTAECHIGYSSHRTSHLHGKTTSNRIKEFSGRVWCVFGGFAHSSILPIKMSSHFLTEKTLHLHIGVTLYWARGVISSC